MSSKYPGGLITKSPAATVGPSGDFNDGGSAPGIWSVDQAMALQKAGVWPSRIKTRYLWSWGLNSSGQLGLNDAVHRSSPVQIGALTTWSLLAGSAGSASFSTAIKTDGTLWAWGANSNGQLGDDTRVSRSSPVQIGAYYVWASGSGGSLHMLSIKSNGTMWSWGRNRVGQLGLPGALTYRSSPVQIGTSSDWAITGAGGETSFAVKTTGTLWAWGISTDAQLGDNTAYNKSSPVQIGALTNWSQTARKLDSGNNHTVAIKSDGTIWSWGNGTYGHLGNNTSGASTNKSSPTQIGALTTWSQVAVGEYFTTALKTDGTMWLWGRNNYGQIGDNTVILRSSPVQIDAGTDWYQISAGNNHNVAIKTNGTLWAWGRNNYGQIGDNTVILRSSPVQIGALTTWSEIASIDYITVATKTDGTLWTWGDNTYGQVGDNTVIKRSSPVQVGLLTTWSKLFACFGSINAAIKTDGNLSTWGSNANGGLGDGTGISRSSPVQIGTAQTETTNWSKAAISNAHTTSIKNDGTLWAWGANDSGQLGSNTVLYRSSPVQIGALTTWSVISGGTTQSAAIKTDGTLWTWGINTYGSLGDNTAINRSSPVQVGALATWSNINAGQDHIMAIKTDGTLWTWGRNASGQLGDNTVILRSSPVQIGALTTWSQIAGGGQQTAALKTDGTLWAWGFNVQGRLGDNTQAYRSSPVQIGALTTWSQLSGGVNHVTALKTDGTLWTWGHNTYGQIGQGNVILRSSPVQIGAEISAWSQFTGGENHSVAIKANGTLWAWGRNSNGGILGLNDAVHRSSPVQVGTGTTWSKVSSAGANTVASVNLAIKTDGSMWSWGMAPDGALGLNDVANKSSPVQIGALTTWSLASAGGYHAAAIKTDGTLWTWGRPSDGSLGISQVTNAHRSSPVQVGILTAWSVISAGAADHNQAIKTDGTLWAWGLNTSGKLGDNTVISRSSPVQIGAGTTWSKISAGYNHNVAIKTDGTLWTWGNGGNGRLGGESGGFNFDRSSPVQIGALTTWASVAAGQQFTVAAKTDGTLWSFGYNQNGQLGVDNRTAVGSPVQVGSQTNWSTVAAGGFNSMAVNTLGILYLAGRNTYGGLGDNTIIPRSSPIQVGSAAAALTANWKKIAGAQEHSLAITAD